MAAALSGEWVEMAWKVSATADFVLWSEAVERGRERVTAKCMAPGTPELLLSPSFSKYHLLSFSMARTKLVSLAT